MSSFKLLRQKLYFCNAEEKLKYFMFIVRKCQSWRGNNSKWKQSDLYSSLPNLTFILLSSLRLFFPVTLIIDDVLRDWVFKIMWMNTFKQIKIITIDVSFLNKVLMFLCVVKEIIYCYIYVSISKLTNFRLKLK